MHSGETTTKSGRTKPLLLAAAVLALAATGCGGDRSAGGPAFQEIASPAGLGSGEAHLGKAPDGHLALSWIEARPGGGHRLLWSSFTHEAWSAPVTIAEGDSFFVNWADFPSFVASGEMLYAHWLWKNGLDTYAYEIRASMSADGGKTWSDPVIVNDDGTATEHGFVSMIPATQNSARLVWLDGRAGEGLEEDDPRRRLQLRSAVVTRELQVRQAALLDDRVCDCCATALVLTPDGALAAYRDRSPDEVRDISLVAWSGEQWEKPKPAWEDGWHISGCPVNGPALDAAESFVALAWYTEAGDMPAVLCAVSTDGGASFPEPVRADDGNPLGRVDVLSLPDGSAILSWLEAAGDGAEVAVRRIRGGRIGPRVPVSRTSGARKSGFPRLARIGDDMFAAWTDVSDSSRVRVARASVTAIPEPGSGE